MTPPLCAKSRAWLWVALAVFLYIQQAEILISLAVAMPWFYFLTRYGSVATPCLLVLSALPFFVSPLYLMAHTGVDCLYLMAQMSPVYLVMRCLGDPWLSPIIYESSPFHYELEPLRTPLGFSVLVLLWLCLLLRRRIATH